jgi:endonuclease YncB( thermonuclease family)
MPRLVLIVSAILLTLGLFQGCRVGTEPTPIRPTAVVSSPTVYATPSLPPTWTAHPPTPTNTRVVPIPPTFTPGPSPTPTRLPARAKALVVGIQDSRTIEVLMEEQPASRGFIVRLLGVEPPLLSDPWATVAVDWLAREVGRKVVVLESDQMERDSQGNLLRYVWKEGRMVNATMVQLGLATTSETVNTLRYGADLLDAQADAQDTKRGLWGPPPTATPTRISVTVTLTTTQIPTDTLVETPTPATTLVATQTLTTTLTPTLSP